MRSEGLCSSRRAPSCSQHFTSIAAIVADSDERSAPSARIGAVPVYAAPGAVCRYGARAHSGHHICHLITTCGSESWSEFGSRPFFLYPSCSSL